MRMKLILIICIGLLSLSVNAQVQTDTIVKSIDMRINSAGESLEKGSSQMIAGMLMTLVGSALIVAGGEGQRPLLIMGAAVSVIGVGFTFSGFGKIGKAGRQLKSSSLY